MNIEQARFNMIEQQIRPWNVLDQDILDLLHVVKREQFVPQAYQNLAFADTEIPLPGGEAMLNPKVEARMAQEAGVKQGDNVLQIGTGSGYLSSLLASKARHVTGSLRAKYDRIRSRRHAQAIFALVDGACGSCDTAVPVQRRTVMSSAGAIDVCEGCGVLLYAAE